MLRLALPVTRLALPQLRSKVLSKCDCSPALESAVRGFSFFRDEFSTSVKKGAFPAAIIAKCFSTEAAEPTVNLEHSSPEPGPGPQVPPAELLWAGDAFFWSKVLPRPRPYAARVNLDAVPEQGRRLMSWLVPRLLFEIQDDDVLEGAVQAYRVAFEHFAEPAFKGDDKFLRSIVTEPLLLSYEEQFEARKGRDLTAHAEVRHIRSHRLARKVVVSFDLATEQPSASSESRLETVAFLPSSDEIEVYARMTPDDVEVLMAYVIQGKKPGLREVFKQAEKFVTDPATRIQVQYDVELSSKERFALYGADGKLVIGSEKIQGKQRLLRLVSAPMNPTIPDLTDPHFRIAAIRSVD